MGLHLGITAGAIISGAYFGDKLSPLSDTTNLAPAMVGSDLFTHIRHILWTTVPSILIALTCFTLLGLFGAAPSEGGNLQVMLDALSSSFNIGWHLLLPLAAVLFVIYKKILAFPALLFGALLGGVFAIVFHQDVVLGYVGETTLPRWVALIKGFWMAMFGTFTAATGNTQLDDQIRRDGMASIGMNVNCRQRIHCDRGPDWMFCANSQNRRLASQNLMSVLEDPET